MKIKRIVLSSLLAASCVLSLALTAFAASEGEVTKDQVKLSGYVAGVDWPLFVPDKIYYTASISGANVENVLAGTTAGGDSNRVYVTPYTDKSSLGKIYLWGERRSVSSTDGTPCGIGAQKAYLKMWCFGETKTLESDLT